MPESYLHKYAKIVMCGWLRKRIRIGEKYKGLNGLDVDIDYKWCVDNGPKGMCNVYPEYPVCSDRNTGEVIGLKYGDWDKWLTRNKLEVVSRSGIPLAKELKKFSADKKLKVLQIFDIAILCEDGLHSVYEIYKTHEVDDKKVKWLKENDVLGYELDAEWIMSRVKPPYKVQLKRKLH